MTVVRMADLKNDSTLIRPAEMLSDAAEQYADGTLVGTKCLVIALDDADGNYNLAFHNAGLSAAEVLALLEVTKTHFLRQMGFLFL